MKPFLLLIFSLVLPFTALAQQTVTAAGGYLQNDDVSISWTLGEIVTETLSNSNIMLTQGQQQFTINVVSAVEKEVAYSVSAYPNPTQGELLVAVSGKGENNISLTLYNSMGVQLKKAKLVVNQPLHLPMADYPAGVYILTLGDGKDYLKSYKIIKQ